jgi:DNA-binding GntR family transcriptional regulator
MTISRGGNNIPAGLADQAYSRLKHDIVWCRLRPGEEVSETKLAAMYGLGKAPIRQALSKLVQEGYVEANRRKGHVISPVTLQSVKDLFDLRLMIEPSAIESACGKVDLARLVELDELCARGYEPGNEKSEAAFMAANYNFHMEIASAGGNERLARVMSQILEESTRHLHLGFVLRERPEAFTREHSNLIEALAAGDKLRARSMAIEHISSVRAMVFDGIIAHSNLSETTIIPKVRQPRSAAAEPTRKVFAGIG